MLHNTHTISADSTYCETCGQLLKAPAVYGSRNSASDRIGIAISIAVHLLALGYYLLRESPVTRAPPPAHDGAMLYMAPLTKQPKAKTPPRQAPLVKLKPPPLRPKQAQASLAPRVRPKQEVFIPPVVAPVPKPVAAPVEEDDMEARIAARRKQRGEVQPEAEVQESAEERGQRVARANIAGAQGRSTGVDKNDAGGVFSILNQTFRSADVKFRGWNGNFKRNWSQQVRVEQGAEIDIETAIVKQMIELIRKEKPGPFVWDSHRLGRHVNLSARVEDTAELKAFLLKEFFPDYRQSAR